MGLRPHPVIQQNLSKIPDRNRRYCLGEQASRYKFEQRLCLTIGWLDQHAKEDSFALRPMTIRGIYRCCHTVIDSSDIFKSLQQDLEKTIEN